MLLKLPVALSICRSTRLLGQPCKGIAQKSLLVSVSLNQFTPLMVSGLMSSEDISAALARVR